MVILVFGALVIFMAIFYPSGLEALGLVGSYGKALLGWPIVIGHTVWMAIGRIE